MKNLILLGNFESDKRILAIEAKSIRKVDSEDFCDNPLSLGDRFTRRRNTVFRAAKNVIVATDIFADLPRIKSKDYFFAFSI